MVGRKFYPRVLPLLVLLVLFLCLAVLGLWLWEHALSIGETLVRPAIGQVLWMMGSVSLAAGTIGVLLFGMPFLQLYVRRRPSLEIQQDRLLLTMGLGRTHELLWRDVHEVRATRLVGRLGLGWVTVYLDAGQNALGKDISVPHLFLDEDVEQVALVLQSFVTGRHRPRRNRRNRNE